MIDQNIGNPEITRKHLSELQTFYEAQLVAKRHYDALMTSLKPLQDAADVLRASGVVNVDALLSQPVSATKAMIEEMEAEADADDDELNDLTLWECEEEDRDFPPMPEGEGWEKNTGKQPFDAWVEVDTVTFGGDTDTCDCAVYLWEFQDSENDIAWYRKAQLERIVDHAAEATAQIEAQAGIESTETEAQPLGFDLPEGAVNNGIGYDQYTGWYADYTVPKTGATGRVYATEGGAGDFQLDLNSDSEPLPHTDDTTEAEPDETVTEQPESPEPETPSQPEAPKAERKSYDFTGDYTEEEIRAKSGFDPRENQPDDIAATERAEFDAPRRHAYNPWAPPAKAEG